MQVEFNEIWRLSGSSGVWFASTWVAKTSASTGASRRASQVIPYSFKSSYSVILAKMLAN